MVSQSAFLLFITPNISAPTYKEGKLRAIGVSNFYPDHFIDLASNVETLLRLWDV
ncbi:MAG: hypothetical protein K2J48_03925 [Muribaculaceae bacterium]|nr:hypothetical protein [Muribaculaceae bacterium]